MTTPEQYVSSVDVVARMFGLRNAIEVFQRLAAAGYEINPRGTADRLAAERDAAIAWAEESALRSIEARNPGIDMDQVRAARADRCACGQPATTTHAGIPTCGDDR